MPPAAYLRPGQQLVSDDGISYESVQKLGKGGNSIVFLVIATSGPNVGTPFAAKIFARVDAPERRAAFANEIRFLRSASHPSVMRVFDQGVYRERFPFVIAEYLPDTLADVIASPPVPVVQRLSYAVQLLSGLNFLASLTPPAIHRDIKPPNCFLKGHSCVPGDFGLLKRVDALGSEDDRQALKRSAGAGMPQGYRTPDLVAYLRGERFLTEKSDVYQLGIVFAELFGGANPQRPARAFTDPVELELPARLPIEHGDIILDLIKQMLTDDVANRPAASGLIRAWHGVFRAAVRRCKARQEKPFP